MAKQPTSEDVDETIAALPRNEQVIVKRLRALILECIPQATEKTYYDFRIPFYTRNRLICFIWPPSLSWESGKDPKKRLDKGVALGFNQGHLMDHRNHLLVAEGRKQVHVMYFRTMADVDERVVRALLFEAAMIDDGFGKKRKSKN